MRFAFSDEWELTKLDRLMVFQNGLNAEPERYGSGIKYISVKDILNNYKITYATVAGRVKATPKEQIVFSVNYGDIVFQRSSEIPEDIGRSNVYLDDLPCIFGGFVIRGKKIGEYEPYFLKTELSSPLYRKSIIRLGAGAQHFNIGQESLKKVHIKLPSMDEQMRIAHLFSNIDKRLIFQNKIIGE